MRTYLRAALIVILSLAFHAFTTARSTPNSLELVQEIKHLERLEFSIEIKADKSTIWKALWDDKSYREWAEVFYEGSYLLCNNWEEGNTIHFLAADKSGIYSKIEKHIPDEIIKFKHIGTVIDGKEQAIDEATKKWSGTTEVYKLSEGTDNSILLTIEIDVLDDHLEFMKNKLPLALEKIKELSIAD